MSDISIDIEAAARPEVTYSVTRGTMRLFRDMGAACISELRLKTGRRADVVALDRKGVIDLVEVKSSIEDFRADGKWEEYLPYCDRFFFAVPIGFPVDILPENTGLIIADAYGASVEREAVSGCLNPARRKAVTLLFARQAAERWMREVDPRP